MAAAGTWVAANATKNLQKGNGLIRDKNSTTNNQNSSTNKTNEKTRVADQKPGEKPQNQLEGIEKAQAKAKQNSSSQGTKQAKINSTEKSK